MMLLLACAGAESTTIDSAAEDPLVAWEAAEGLVMVDVPPGSFVMGSPPEEVGRYIPEEYGGDGTDRETQHEVSFTHTLRVSAVELTQARFEALMGYNPSFYQDCGAECPVEWVTWDEAAAYTVALSAHAGLEGCYTCEGEGAAVSCQPLTPISACPGYRLPTEAEWEYFGRAGQAAAFLGGGGIAVGQEEDCSADLALDNGAALSDEAWWCGNATMPQPIAGRPANAWGLYDIEGNIHEWTNDWYDITEYTTAEAGEPDPEGPAEGVEKVRRGGGYLYEPWRLRLAYRGWHVPDEPGDQVGLRIVRSVP